jgi:hypothetical protein
MKKLLKSSLSLAMAALMSLSMFAHAGEAVADDHASSVATMSDICLSIGTEVYISLSQQ